MDVPINGDLFGDLECSLRVFDDLVGLLLPWGDSVNNDPAVPNDIYIWNWKTGQLLQVRASLHLKMTEG